MYAAAKYGLATGQPLSRDQHAASNSAVTTTGPAGLSLENPLLWLVGLGAVTIGLAAVSVSGRIGPIKASISGGK